MVAILFIDSFICFGKQDIDLNTFSSIQTVDNDLYGDEGSKMTNNSNCYKLYPTENMYTFLRLNTKTGLIWQVQWSLESDSEFVMLINSRDLSINGYKSGTFELYPTKNTFQFLLLDVSVSAIPYCAS